MSLTAYSLQWGRGLSPRIGDGPADYLAIGLMLQWGRGLSPRIGFALLRQAWESQNGFNGAAVCHRGSATNK